MDAVSNAAGRSELLQELGLTLDLRNLHEGLCIYTLDAEGEIKAEFASHNCSKCMGLDAELNCPTTLSGLPLDEKSRSEYSRQLRQAFVSLKPFKTEQRFERKNGTVCWRRVDVKPIEHQGKVYLIELCEDSSQEHHRQQQLKEYNARLTLSLEQTSQKLWEIDLISGYFSIFDPTVGEQGSASCRLRFPEDLLTGGWIHPENVSNFKIFAKKILGGERRGGAAFMMRTLTGSGYTWYALSFRMLFNEDNLPVKAIGILSSLDPAAAAQRFALYSRLWEYLLPSLYSYVCFNVTEDRLEQFWQTGRNLTNAAAALSYEEFLEQNVQHLFSMEERQRVMQEYSKEALLEHFYHGHRWLFNQFDVVEDGGYVRKIAVYTILTRPETTGAVVVFTYMQYIDKAVNRLGEIFAQGERLPESGLYTSSSAKTLIQYCESSARGSCAHILIHFCNFKGEHDPRSYHFIANAFALYFEADAICSDLAQNTISVFIPDCASLLRARQLTESSFMFVRRILSDTPLSEIRFTAALCFGKLKGLFYDDFLQEGLTTCQYLENSPSDHIAYVPPKSENPDMLSENLLYSTDLSAMRYAKIKETLNAEEEQLIFKCLDLILTASNRYTALQWVLENLGHYYRADRVYALQLIENSMTVEELGEWDNSGRPSFRGMLTGMHIDKTPLLRRAIDTQQPVNLPRRDRSLIMQNGSNPNDLSITWAFSAYPLISVKDNFKAVLCIDNPHSEEGNLALVAALKVYLLKLLQQLVEERFTDEGGQILGGKIYGLKDFNEQLPRLTSEIYTSMGVFTLCVPQMLQLSHEYGYEHCLRLLKFIKELLSRSFGNSFIFNVLEQEFVILVPNTIKEIFFDRVKLVQDIINHNYQGQVFFGATWSRGSFVSEDLVKEATTLMLSSLPGLNCRPHSLQEEFESLNPKSSSFLKQFTVYFQPKIDIQSGKLAGAEALVRGVADDGSIVSPGRFIARMEKSGTLRDLDLFVLSRVLWQQQDWKRRGLKVVPVSVNFSRFTMFDSATAGAVLAILSHYDEDSAHEIEIEITETSCAVENVTLNRAMMLFRNLGLSFALDDFGTGYANLSIFSNVHFDSIKLDRSLIADIAVNKVSQSLLESIVRISHDSSMKVIAEGVEHQEQVNVLLKSGCYLAQGFLYDRALEPGHFAEKYLKSA